MLGVPDSALGRSSKPSARQIEILADWFELWVLTEGASVSSHDVLDRLLEEYIFSESDTAYAAIEDVFSLANERQEEIGSGYPFRINQDSLELTPDPLEYPVYPFLLLASCAEYFSTVRFKSGSSHRELFERIVVEAVKNALPEWDVFCVVRLRAN